MFVAVSLYRYEFSQRAWGQLQYWNRLAYQRRNKRTPSLRDIRLDLSEVLTAETSELFNALAKSFSIRTRYA